MTHCEILTNMNKIFAISKLFMINMITYIHLITLLDISCRIFEHYNDVIFSNSKAMHIQMHC